MNHLELMLSSILALGIAAQWLGWFTKKPSIIFLLGTGILLGPTFHLFNPDDIFDEELLFTIVSLGVSIILFEGALTLKVKEIKNHGGVVTNLVSIGVLITIAITSAAAFLIMGMTYQMSLLFGALVCVTGPTVIVPLLRTVKPNRTIGNILRWEGVIIDPIGALFVVLIYEFIIAGHSPMIFGIIIALGLSIGFITAIVVAFLLKRLWVPEYLHNVFTLASVIFVFSLSNSMVQESGLLTVTVMGMVMANLKTLKTESILNFKESLSIIIISFLFILLSARIDFNGFKEMGYRGLIVLVVIMFIARPVSVWVSAIGSSLSVNEKILISWMAPRGIVAAAVSSLFVMKLRGTENAASEILVPLVFTIIIGTVAIQSLTAKMLAKLLNVAESTSNGVLIMGSGPLAILIAKAIKQNGFDVIVASMQYEQTKRARMEGITAYYGNIVSEHADQQLSLVGIGHLLALESRNEDNMLATLRYRTEFGHKYVYRIKTTEDQSHSQRQKTKREWQTAWLFNDNIDYDQISYLLQEESSVKTTNISDNYTFEQYCADNPNNIPLFAIDSQKNQLRFFTSDKILSVAPGWKIVALVANAKEQLAEKNAKKRDEKLIKGSDKKNESIN